MAGARRSAGEGMGVVVGPGDDVGRVVGGSDGVARAWCAAGGARRGVSLVAAVVVCLAVVRAALAGGGPQNVLLIVDPESADGKAVANYYLAARGVPLENVVYLDPQAANYPTWVDDKLDVLFGMLANRGVEDHIDYIVVAPGVSFYVPAAGFIWDPCSPVRRFSMSSVFTMAFLAEDILASSSQNSQGPMTYSTRNQYASDNNTAIGFDSSLRWFRGIPDDREGSRQYFIGMMLGYTGARGNSVGEILDLIDRSVAVDGTMASGASTFYFMETTDDARSGPRDAFYPVVVAALQGLGFGAEHLCCDPLPIGRHDCLGIMTGWANPDIMGGDFTIMPGAFCDHLTSFAGTFDNSSQTKMSDWIRKGASGSHGTVEEPCNYSGKFPNPRLHVYYAQGLSLGESLLRSLIFTPYQGLMYGDPLTRPFAYIPQVDVPDAPTGPVSGTLVLTPEATTDNPDAGVGFFELYIDGVFRGQVGAGGSFQVDTTLLADGFHDVVVAAFEDSLVATQGHWFGTVEVNNFGRSVSVAASPTTGDLGTLFTVSVAASGGAVREIRLLHNGRVLGAVQGPAGEFPIWGSVLGGTTVQLVAVAEYEDNRLARSAVEVVDVALSAGGDGPPGNSPPVAYDYILDVPAVAPIVVDLPATDVDSPGLTYSVVEGPSQGTVSGDGPTRVLRPDAGASGTDTIRFVANDGLTDSNVATITVRYGGLQNIPGDFDGDGDVDIADFAFLSTCFTGGGIPCSGDCCRADLDGDGDVDIADFSTFSANFTGSR